MYRALFITYDQQSFPIEDAVILLSPTLKRRLQGEWAGLLFLPPFSSRQQAEEKGEDVQIAEVSAETYLKLAEWCRHHLEAPLQTPKVVTSVKDGSSFDIDPWYQEFMTSLSQEELFEMMIAAQAWDIQPLLDLAAKTVATMLKGKSAQQIRELFDIENDFTPEEEAAIKKEHEWTD
ncbi:hypothetical protein FRC17_005556 [Serendipita sp. 399]|nr:hypothetical protein FRC17_005556 [Serendipita sp. 399]